MVCQRHAVVLDLSALYTFLLRERIGKETREKRDQAYRMRRDEERRLLMWLREAEAE